MIVRDRPLFSLCYTHNRYNHYLAVDMMASSEDEHRAWVGWVESRLRKVRHDFPIISNGGRFRLDSFEAVLCGRALSSPRFSSRPRCANHAVLRPAPCQKTLKRACYLLGYRPPSSWPGSSCQEVPPLSLTKCGIAQRADQFNTLDSTHPLSQENDVDNF